ncbi:hypothetical protein [Gymnodinialimonas hymeniacidonis]|uniref:hypothetical protein n=1 Tax=Gymnodinialimonas hymeniacidonis TaxID=3126508 RepID=UPI0034C6456A
MKRIFVLSMTTAIGLSNAAQAGPIDPTIGFSGDVRIGAFDISNADRLDYFDLDLTARVLFTPFFGIDLGYDGFSEFNGPLRDRYTAYFFYEFFEGGTIGAGYVPSPIGQVTLDDRIGYGAPIEFEVGAILLEPFPHLIALLDEEPVAGLLYEGNYGSVWAGASVHFNPSGDGEVYSVAATYSGSLANGIDYDLGGGVEYVDSETADDFVRIFARANLENENFDGGLAIVGGDSPLGSDRLTVIDASVGYTPDIPTLAGSLSSELRLGADLTHAFRSNGGSTLTVYGLGAEITFEEQFGLGLSAGRTDSGGGSDSEWVAIEAFLRF